jgi:hypothetical protein
VLVVLAVGTLLHVLVEAPLLVRLRKTLAAPPPFRGRATRA